MSVHLFKDYFSFLLGVDDLKVFFWLDHRWASFISLLIMATPSLKIFRGKKNNRKFEPISSRVVQPRKHLSDKAHFILRILVYKIAI